MNLIVDIGNTLVKLAVFDGGRIVAQRCVERLHPSMLGELLEGRRAAKAVVASTRGEADDVVETVRPYADYLLEFTSQTPVPVANAYHTPETLGRDRLAAAVGATVLYPGRNVLIVDFGTAVTIDLVTADNTFRGGDAKYFAKRIKNTIFANCNLVFCGLDRILEYNASEEHLD